MTVLPRIPVGLLASALLAAVLLTILSGVLIWHGLRRVLDVPRVPRPRGMYWALALMWGALAAAFAATTTATLLLRDHQRLSGRTELGEIRCEPTTAGHIRMEIRAAAPSLAVTPESYEADGDRCAVSVKEVELRPGLKALGLGAVARVDAVGTVTRPTANPGWLTPVTSPPHGLLGLIVERTNVVQILVPADPKQRFVLVATPGQDPGLEPTSI